LTLQGLFQQPVNSDLPALIKVLIRAVIILLSVSRNSPFGLRRVSLHFDNTWIQAGSEMKMKRISFVFVLLSVCLVSLLFFGGCKKKQEKPQTAPPAARHEVVAKTTLLAQIPQQDIAMGTQAMPAGHVSVPSGPGGPPPGHASTSPGQNPDLLVWFSKLGGGAAYIAQRAGKAHLVYNGKAGKPYDEIDPLTVLLSDDGQRIAYGARSGTKWMMVIAGTEEGPYEQVGSAAFSPDGMHVAYQARKRGKWHLVSGGEMSAGCDQYHDKPMFSGDSTRIYARANANVEDQQRLIVTDLAFQNQRVKVLRGKYFFTNESKTRIGAIEDVNGRERVIEFDFNTLDVVKEGELYDSVRFPSFAPDGVTVSYAAAQRQGKGVVFRYLILGDRKERLPDDAPMTFPVIRPDNKGAGMIMSTRTNYYLHQAFFNNGTKKKYYDEAGDLACSKDGSLYAFAARQGKKIFIAVNEKAGPAFDHVTTPVFSPDGRKVVYRARAKDKRFIVVADANGGSLRKHPGYERVFEPVFTADGKSLAYGVKDGDKLVWKVEKL
jgi:WD40 repeat protein